MFWLCLDDVDRYRGSTLKVDQADVSSRKARVALFIINTRISNCKFALIVCLERRVSSFFYIKPLSRRGQTKASAAATTVRLALPGQVVLQHLRPFAPLEVVNTRVCSRASPAPGNDGFDGCLELLSLTCRAHERALTVWDDSSFVYIDVTGACSSLPKRAMLHLSLPTLRFLMKNMRGFTVCGGGNVPPREVARAVTRSVGWGAKQVRRWRVFSCLSYAEQ